MGFKDAKRDLLNALKSGTYLHEARDDISEKNKLLTGEVTAEFIAEIVVKSRGHDHSMSPHHADKTITVHVIQCRGWYIKFYFIAPETWIISVHQ